MRYTGKHQFGTSQLTGVSINVDTHGTIGTTGQQFEYGATPTADIEQITYGCGHGQIENCTVQRTDRRIVLTVICEDTYSLTPILLEQIPVRLKDRVIVRNQRQQLHEPRRDIADPGYPVKHSLTVPEARQQSRFAERLQLLRDSRLTLPDDVCQLRNTALPSAAQCRKAQPGRIA